MKVLIHTAHAHGVLAWVDGASVRVKVRPPAHGKPRLPKWTCSECPTRGRDWCPHIDALAATEPTPGQLERITDPRPPRRKP